MSRKVALVTGANRGLGLELATQLGQRGLSVIITGRNNNAAQAASGRLRALGYDVDAMGIDVSDPNSIRAFKTQAAFESWLSKQHDKAPEVYLRIFKKGSGQPSVTS